MLNVLEIVIDDQAWLIFFGVLVILAIIGYIAETAKKKKSKKKSSTMKTGDKKSKEEPKESISEQPKEEVVVTVQEPNEVATTEQPLPVELENQPTDMGSTPLESSQVEQSFEPTVSAPMEPIPSTNEGSFTVEPAMQSYVSENDSSMTASVSDYGLPPIQPTMTSESSVPTMDSIPTTPSLESSSDGLGVSDMSSFQMGPLPEDGTDDTTVRF